MSYRLTSKFRDDISFFTLDQHLYYGGDLDAPTWLVHPTRSDDIDLVAIPISKETLAKLDRYSTVYPGNRIAVQYLNELENHRPDMDFSVGADVVVAGYPLYSLKYHYDSAIWKHGVVASEPQVEFDGHRRFLLDARTGRGMSGSPVILLARGGAFQSTSGALVQGVNHVGKVIGVYAGRYGQKGLGYDLAYVWQYELVNEIIDGRRIGASPFNRSL